jgi:hypothetical protein
VGDVRWCGCGEVVTDRGGGETACVFKGGERESRVVGKKRRGQEQQIKRERTTQGQGWEALRNGSL